jgi:ZIP family zinc transporter
MIVSAAVVWAGHLAIPYLHSAGEKTMPNWPLKKSAYLVLLALILHDVPEGFAMANAYIASPEVGVLVAPAISLHNLPEEFAMAAPAIR